MILKNIYQMGDTTTGKLGRAHKPTDETPRDPYGDLALSFPEERQRSVVSRPHCQRNELNLCPERNVKTK